MSNMSGILLLSHCGSSFIENLSASVRARGLRVFVLTSQPTKEVAHRLIQLGELADVVLHIPSRHELIEQDVVTALETLRTQGENPIACLSVWEGYRRLMAQTNAWLDVQDLNIQTVDLLADKLRVREMLFTAGISHVHAEPATDEALQAWLREGRAGFVKPRRGIASYGAQRLKPNLTGHSLAGLIEASRTDPVYGSFLGSSTFFIEDYVPGVEHSFEVLVFESQAHVVTVHEKLELTITESSVLEDACVSPPLSWDRDKHSQVSTWVTAILSALGATWGCFHIEARLTPKGWELIEVNPRVGGALISHSSGAQHGGRSLLDQWLDILLDQRGSEAERLRNTLATQANSYPTDRATFFRIYFAQPGLISNIKRNELSRPPDSIQCFLGPGTTVPSTSREIFLGQALWIFTRQESSDIVTQLLVESRRALEVTYDTASTLAIGKAMMPTSEYQAPHAKAKGRAQRWLIIIDYNLTRRDEVLRLRNYAAERHQMSTVLIRAKPTVQDQLLCDVIIDLEPLSPGFVDEALATLSHWSGIFVAGIVFSDRAMVGGTRLLRQLQLRVDDPQLAVGAFSKAVYRETERQHVALMDAQGIDCTASQRLTDMAQAIAFVRDHPEGTVIKPSCEGNNRGVSVVRNVGEVKKAWEEVLPYLKDGIVAEAFIKHRREYSCDGVGRLMFFTEKLSFKGTYPVELGQLVPARLTPLERATLERGGRLANLFVGQSEGPFHNEIRLSDDGQRAAVVEPNRRPAGMQIWKLAERVFGVSLYACLIDAALGEHHVTQLPPAKGQAAVAMLGVASDTQVNLEQLPPYKVIIDRVLSSTPPAPLLEWFEFKWLPQQPRYLAQPQDNGGFLASACFYTPTGDFDLVTWIDCFRLEWANVITEILLAFNAPVQAMAPADITTRSNMNSSF